MTQDTRTMRILQLRQKILLGETIDPKEVREGLELLRQDREAREGKLGLGRKPKVKPAKPAAPPPSFMEGL